MRGRGRGVGMRGRTGAGPRGLRLLSATIDAAGTSLLLAFSGEVTATDSPSPTVAVSGFPDSSVQLTGQPQPNQCLYTITGGTGGAPVVEGVAVTVSAGEGAYLDAATSDPIAAITDGPVTNGSEVTYALAYSGGTVDTAAGWAYGGSNPAGAVFPKGVGNAVVVLFPETTTSLTFGGLTTGESLDGTLSFPDATFPLLNTVDCSHNSLTAIPTPPALATLDGQSNDLDSAAVDAVLVGLDGNGLSDGFVDLTSNAAPGAAGLAAKASLEGRGWTVNVDE